MPAPLSYGDIASLTLGETPAIRARAAAMGLVWRGGTPAILSPTEELQERAQRNEPFDLDVQVVVVIPAPTAVTAQAG